MSRSQETISTFISTSISVSICMYLSIYIPISISILSNGHTFKHTDIIENKKLTCLDGVNKIKSYIKINHVPIL